jgi:hypothetical protein
MDKKRADATPLPLTQQERLSVIRANLNQVSAAIYNQELSHRVANRVRDKDGMERAAKEMERLESILDAYREIERELTGQGPAERGLL